MYELLLLFLKSILYFDFKINVEALHPSPESITTISNISMPEKCYGKFLSNVSRQVSPLFTLLQNLNSVGSLDCQKTFNWLKA